MLIETSTSADLPAIVDLVNSAYRGEAAQRGWTTEAAFLAGQRTSLALLQEELAPSAKRVVVAREEKGGALRGCVLLDLSDPDVAYMGMLSVDPSVQSQGLGKTLMAAAAAVAQEHGAKRMRITVIQVREALIGWYERHGFARTGTTEPFPYGDERFGIPLRDDLHFVVLEKPLR
jgi:ribosomal protein S18 acetylase RimI-like enzyme